MTIAKTGGGIAKRLVGQGKAVHLVGRNEQALSSLASELGGCSFSVCNVLEPSQIERAVQEAGDHVDGLAYCVGTIVLKRLNQVSKEDMLNDFSVHCVGAALAVKAASAKLKESKRGSVVRSLSKSFCVF
jgi:short-subunit dehydrogenase